MVVGNRYASKQDKIHTTNTLVDFQEENNVIQYTLSLITESDGIQAETILYTAFQPQRYSTENSTQYFS